MNPLEDAVYRAAEYGGGEPMTIDVGPGAVTRLDPDAPADSPLLAGATIAVWR